MRMFLALLVGSALTLGPAMAQSPPPVPLTQKTPSPETTVPRPSPNLTPTATTSANRAPNARNRRNGRVAPPSAVDTPVQVIAPERKR